MERFSESEPGDGEVQSRLTVAIEISGDPAQLASVFARLAEVFGDDAVHSTIPHRGSGTFGTADAPSQPRTWWTEKRAEAFVAELRPPALFALRVIAAGAPKTGIAHVQAEMANVGLPATPGTLSSIGFAVRRLGCPPPFVRDRYQRAYVMDTEVAGHLLKATDREHRRRQDSLTNETVTSPKARRRRRSPR
jgi:hypothetical protein